MEGYGYEDDRDPMNGLLSPGAPGVTSEEIHIDSELVTILSHRSRRRLRELQTSCKVAARLDRAKQVVYVTGTQEAIKAARQAIESLSGPKKSVPLAVWAELMRTRTMSLEDLSHQLGGLTKESQVSVAWVQEKSGCRLHIERGSCEVRIFGSKVGTEVASKLVDDMAPLCCEETVPVQDVASLTSPVLQSIAHACAATFRVQSSSIVVLGLAKYVRNGVEQLIKFLAMPHSYSVPEKLSQAPGSAISNMPVPEFKSEVEVDSQPKRFENVCPTCKCGPFCSNCGQMIWKTAPLGTVAPQPSQASCPSGPVPYQFVVMQPMEAGNMKNMNNMMMPGLPANMMQPMPSMQNMQNMQNMQTMQSSMMPVCMPMAMVAHPDLAAGG